MQKQLQQIDDEDYTQFLQEKKEEEANIMNSIIPEWAVSDEDDEEAPSAHIERKRKRKRKHVSEVGTVTLFPCWQKRMVGITKEMQENPLKMFTTACSECGTRPLPSLQFGPLWKCLDCADYFLCSSCEKKRALEVSLRQKKTSHSRTHVFVLLPYPGLSSLAIPCLSNWYATMLQQQTPIPGLPTTMRCAFCNRTLLPHQVKFKCLSCWRNTFFCQNCVLFAHEEPVTKEHEPQHILCKKLDEMAHVYPLMFILAEPYTQESMCTTRMCQISALTQLVSKARLLMNAIHACSEALLTRFLVTRILRCLCDEELVAGILNRSLVEKVINLVTERPVVTITSIFLGHLITHEYRSCGIPVPERVFSVVANTPVTSESITTINDDTVAPMDVDKTTECVLNSATSTWNFTSAYLPPFSPSDTCSWSICGDSNVDRDIIAPTASTTCNGAHPSGSILLQVTGKLSVSCKIQANGGCLVFDEQK